MGVSVLKNVAEAPAYLATIATSPLVGIGTAMSGGNGWEAMGTYVFNNKYLETVQGIKDSIDENVLKSALDSIIYVKGQNNEKDN